MSIQALLLKRVLKLIQRWWKRRQAWQAVKEAPPVKPPERRVVQVPKPHYNRNIHSQQMKEEHEKRTENN